jgi:homoserine kinase type II
MAVFTPVSPAQMDQFLKSYALGELLEIQGIESGIENSNFFVTTQLAGVQSRYILTLFERLSHARFT